MDVYVESLLRPVFSIAGSSFAVLFVTIPLACIGMSVSRIVGHKADATVPTSVAYGLSLAAFLAYYAHLLEVSIVLLFTTLSILGYILFFLQLWKFLGQKRLEDPAYIKTFQSLKGDGFAFVSLSVAFFSLNLLTLKSSEVAPGVVGNHDIYFWAACADQLLGRFNFSNIFPAGEIIWNANLREDSNGTYYALAFMAVQLNKTALEATPLFMGALIIWTGMVISELAELIFKLRKSISVLVAIIVVCGAFFHHIAYNYLAGQMLATFVFLTLVYVSLVIFSDPTSSYLAYVSKLFPLLSLLIISYQSGFLVFFSALLLYVLILSFTFKVPMAEAAKKVAKIPVSMLLGLVLSFSLYPLTIGYLLQRTAYVGTIKMGWELPFLGANYLFSLPTPFQFPSTGDLTSSPSPVPAILSVVISIAIMFLLIAKIVRKNKSCHGNGEVIWLSGAVFALGLLGYSIAFLMKGNAYQVWKLASFIVMPVSFVPISIIACWLIGLSASISLRAVIPRFFSAVRPVAIALFLGLIGASLGAYAFRSAGVSVVGTIKEFKKISNELAGADSVVLDLQGYREILIAFNIFSGTYKLLPLSESYLAKAELNSVDFGAHTKWLTTDRCNVLIRDLMSTEKPAGERDISTSHRYVVISNPLSMDGPRIGTYSFGTAADTCLLGNALKIIRGLSGPESFGRWSDGSEVELQFYIPAPLRGRELILTFGLAPFLTPSSERQYVTPFLGKLELPPLELRRPEPLTIKLNRELTNVNAVNLTFKISDPVRPSEMGVGSSDTRLLGVAFKNLTVEVID